MRVSLDCMKVITQYFLDSDRKSVSLVDLINSFYQNYEDDNGELFMFHYMILIDNKYVSNLHLDTEKMGIFPQRNGEIDFIDIEIRLTAVGLEFAEALEQPTIFEKLKSISDSPLSVIKDVGIDLVKAYARKKLDL